MKRLRKAQHLLPKIRALIMKIAGFYAHLFKIGFMNTQWALNSHLMIFSMLCIIERNKSS